MEKRVWWLGAIAMSVFVLGGCATISKNDELSNQGLRNKVSALEAQLSEKENEINSLKEALAKADQSAEIGNIQEVKQPDVKMIQSALKNAGYFQGVIDGKMGKKTRQAIKDFQKANNLHADGRVGKNTWVVLKGYLDKKVK